MTTTSTTSSTADAQAVWAALNGSKAKSSSTSGSDSATGIAATQNQFLKLLTTQLRNQDPLNPMDNAQMTSQLAQISTVEGITQLNTTMQTLMGNATDSQAMQAASLVGHAVLVPGASISVASGVAIGAGFDLAGAADKATVTIKDAGGKLVRTLKLESLDAGTNTFKWDGKDDDGKVVADGKYKFSVAAVQGKNDVTTTALSVGFVDSVARTSTGVNLSVGTLGTFGFKDVREVL